MSTATPLTGKLADPDFRRRRSRKAAEAYATNAAERAVDDPVKLARAARIVRAAIERRRLTIADVTSEPVANDAA